MSDELVVGEHIEEHESTVEDASDSTKAGNAAKSRGLSESVVGLGQNVRERRDREASA